MFVWTFLYAFLTFIIFISGLIGLASLAMGAINRDRSWFVFGLKALLIAILAFIVICISLWPLVNALGEGLANIIKTFHKILDSFHK